MARSAGYKMTRDLHNFLRILGVTEDSYNNIQFTEAQAIQEIRNICHKYLPLPVIQNDLTEALLTEQAQAANDNQEIVELDTSPE